MKCNMEKVSVLVWIVLVLFCSKPIRSERWDGNTLYDLEGEGSDFLAQAMNWTAVSLKDTLNSSNRVTTCNGSDILGGYNILATGKGNYWEKNLTNLPSHNQISFFMDFFPVDSWDKSGGDHFQMQFDDNITEGWIVEVFGNSVWSHPICGNPGWNDIDNIKTYIVLPHNSSTLNFRVISQLDEATDNESFGFRNISFVFETVGTPTNDLCGSTVFPLPNNWCPCPFTHEYMYPTGSGTCYECDDSCVTCSGPNSNQCLSCKTEDGFYLSSGSCLPCGSTCLTCTGGGANQCITCHNGDYLVGNNTCVPICPEPFYPTTNTVIDFCETPCPSKFAYKNGACSSTCSDPFEAYVLSVLKACVCFSSGATDSDPCYSCDVSCVTCNGTAANDCLTCFEGFYLENEPDLETGTCEPCDPTCATCYGGDANQCNSCFSHAFLVLDGSVNNGTCSRCDGSCLTCEGPENTDCLSCPASFYLDVNPSPAVDGACVACNSTCASCAGSAYNECLTCYSGEYLVTNNTCIPECNSPFFSTSNGIIDFCDTPCLGQYAFQNQTCTDTCTATSYQAEETAVVLKACICTGYLYSNGSCLASCKSPMTIREENGQKFCDFNCPSGDYLNYDGTCSTDCGLPSIPRAEGGYLFCDYGGCDNVDITHLKHTPTGHDYQVIFLPETTCNPAASLVQDILNTNEDLKTLLSNPQFIVQKKNNVYNVQLILATSVLNNLEISVRLIGLDGTMPIPKKLVQTELTQSLTNMANAAAAAVGAITGSNIIASLSLKGTASAWGFVGFQQFITFFKYANIDYPLQLEFFFILGGTATLSSAPNWLAKLTDIQYIRAEENDNISEELTPPEKFFYYDITSFFIKNGGAIFLINWAALAIVLIVILIKKISFVKKSKAYKFIEIAEDKLRWNLVLRSFLSTALPQSISIFLQLRVLSNQDAYVIVSAVLAFIALAHYIGMCGFVFYILYKNSFEDLKKEEIKKRYSTLIDEVDLKSNYAKYYHVLILLRGTLLAIMVVYAEKIALLQVIIMIAFNVGLVSFLFVKIRFEEKRQTIKTGITETLIVLMEICFAMLTRDGETENYYNIIGWVTYGLIGVMFLNELIFALTSQYIGVRKALKTLKNKYNTWKKNRIAKKLLKVDTIQKTEEPINLILIEARSGLTSPPSEASPEGHNEPLQPDNSPKEVNSSKDNELPHNSKIDIELILGEFSPISMGEPLEGFNERQKLWRKADQTPRPRQIVSEPVTLENIEEESSLLDLK